jgi:hypothetical protein
MKAPPASQWAKGTSEGEQHEWLVDCYRMRVDDDYAWGGGYLHGLYDPDHTSLSLVLDFLVFCKLAVEKGALPAGWRWAPFLDVAAGLLPYAFEKSDAQEKYGRENVFSAMMGGRSLRFTGEAIMGSSVMGQGQSAEDRRLCREVEQFDHALNGNDAFFNDVGGVALWRKLLATLETRAPRQ